jgi:LmbE family N-acetylglucosaminyl deacetylase
MAEAAARLGLPPEAVRWAGLVDGTVREHEDELAALCGSLIAELGPHEVYSTSAEEPNTDHAAVGRAVRRAVASARVPVRLLEYPVWLWGAWPLRRGDRVRSTADAAGRLLRRQVTKVHTGVWLAGKMHALQAHGSQLRRPSVVPADEDWAALPPHLLAAAGDRAELFLPVN